MAEPEVLWDALINKVAYLKENMETLSMKQVRRMLEQDLKLGPKKLDVQKPLIEKLVDQVLSGKEPDFVKSKGTKPSKAGKAKTAASKRRRAAGESDDDAADGDGSEEEQPAKRKKTQSKVVKAASGKGSAAKGSGKGAKAATAPAKKHSAAVEKLKRVCREAGIAITPNIYVQNKDEESLTGALESLLERHGLSVNSDPRRIQKVRKQLETAKDLDGIDTTNIIEEGSGRRPRRAAANVSFKSIYTEAGGDAAEEGEESVGASDDDAASADSDNASDAEIGDDSEGEEAERPKAQKATGSGQGRGRAKKQRRSASGSGSDAAQGEGDGERAEGAAAGAAEWGSGAEEASEEAAKAGKQEQKEEQHAKRPAGPPSGTGDDDMEDSDLEGVGAAGAARAAKRRAVVDSDEESGEQGAGQRAAGGNGKASRGSGGTGAVVPKKRKHEPPSDGSPEASLSEGVSSEGAMDEDFADSREAGDESE